MLSPHYVAHIRRRFASWALALGFVTASSGCAQFEPSHQLVPAPAGAIAATQLAGGRVAILAGSDQAKGLFIVDLGTGTVEMSFGVTREATGLTSGEDGTLLLSVGGRAASGAQFGAVERWTLAGVKDRVVPMPAPAVGITRAIGGVAYALVATDHARAAIPIDLASLRVRAPIPLDADGKDLDQCRVGNGTYLLFTEGDGTVAARDLAEGTTRHSLVVAGHATCIFGGQWVCAIAEAPTTRSIIVLDFPGMSERRAIPASEDASALYEASDHDLLVLDSTPREADLEDLPSAQLRSSAKT